LVRRPRQQRAGRTGHVEPAGQRATFVGMEHLQHGIGQGVDGGTLAKIADGLDQ
jgi:hypothetical protein